MGPTAAAAVAHNATTRMTSDVPARCHSPRTRVTAPVTVPSLAHEPCADADVLPHRDSAHARHPSERDRLGGERRHVSAFHRLDDHVRSVAVAAGALVVVTGLSACSGNGDGARSAGVRSPAATASAAPTPTGAVRRSERLSAHLARWRLPAARSREVALRTDTGVLVAGGLSAAQVSTASVWLLSTATGAAKPLAPLAAGVHDATGVVVHGRPLLIAGGNTTT